MLKGKWGRGGFEREGKLCRHFVFDFEDLGMIAEFRGEGSSEIRVGQASAIKGGGQHDMRLGLGRT